jgi:hypothetical protein
MKIIITENQQDLLKDRLKNMVKNVGWEQASDVVGGSDNLLKLVFDNNPRKLLNLFDDLNMVQSETHQDWTLFKNKKGNTIILYDRKENVAFISFSKIWSFLEKGLRLDRGDIKDIVNRWVRDVYDLKNVIVAAGRWSEVT